MAYDTHGKHNNVEQRVEYIVYSGALPSKGTGKSCQEASEWNSISGQKATVKAVTSGQKATVKAVTSGQKALVKAVTRGSKE